MASKRTLCPDSKKLVIPMILVNQFSEDKVLKPDYSRRFSAILDDAPSDWGGKVSIKVTNIVFDAKH
jgi:hypothetical protein